MANHLSALKRIRQTQTRRAANTYQHKTARNAVRKLRLLTSKKEALSFLPRVCGMLDKLVKRNIIHKNKSANLKSKLTRYVGTLK